MLLLHGIVSTKAFGGSIGDRTRRLIGAGAQRGEICRRQAYEGSKLNSN